jgi:hypothetical protein
MLVILWKNEEQTNLKTNGKLNKGISDEQRYR